MKYHVTLDMKSGFRSPGACCCCQRETQSFKKLSDTKKDFEASGWNWQTFKTLDIKIPLCDDCKAHESKHTIRLIFFSLLLLFVPLGGLISAYSLFEAPSTNLILGWTIGSFTILITLHIVSQVRSILALKNNGHAAEVKPVDSKLSTWSGGKIKLAFKSEKFARTFAEMNGTDVR